ncbi:hypothetical protein ACFFHH_24975 [Cytobacillus solani]|uniref:Uncharacterized protein n=1 Tax=Cytobacillus solani TaxID=1637975 RepID=A0A0Q3QMT8_9BACI|nr:hypothetical protein [Cytobacillus solani]KOP81924.1 hypothetical protein AMS60_05150 [Bacillus sp. FJAT-21945]KQL18936.1 hypothetical protein AN957_10360 [Cytobacillus solani]USK56855.1 hypothetical protein LIS82_10435 [Cytobacillus solani]
MIKHRIIIVGIFSLVITLISPFVFYSYFETQPKILNQQLSFGGPFPYAEQTITLPAGEELYPLEIKFESPFERETKFNIIPFILSFVCFFLFFFAIYSIIARFFKGKPVKEPQ